MEHNYVTSSMKMSGNLMLLDNHFRTGRISLMKVRQQFIAQFLKNKISVLSLSSTLGYQFLQSHNKLLFESIDVFAIIPLTWYKLLVIARIMIMMIKACSFITVIFVKAYTMCLESDHDESLHNDEDSDNSLPCSLQNVTFHLKMDMPSLTCRFFTFN